MNERIKLLAIEATLIAAEPNGFDPTRLSMSQQKFAELIVQECMTNLYLNGYDDAVLQIQKHFGVEE